MLCYFKRKWKIKADVQQDLRRIIEQYNWQIYLQAAWTVTVFLNICHSQNLSSLRLLFQQRLKTKMAIFIILIPRKNASSGNLIYGVIPLLQISDHKNIFIWNCAPQKMLLIWACSL